MLKKNIPLLLSILSGILIGTSYIPFPPWAVLFAFVPLWSCWNENSTLKNIFFTGWVTQFVLTLIGFNWVAHTIHEFGHLPLPVAYLGMFLFCCFGALYIPISGVIWGLIVRRYKIQKHYFFSYLLLASIAALMEVFIPQIFSWNLGYTLFWSKLPSYNIAEYIGFQGLSGVLILINAFILFALEKRRANLSLSITSAIAGLIIFITLNIWGYFVQQNIAPANKMIRVLAVQANIGNLEKEYAEQGAHFRDSITQRYISLTTTAALNYQATQNKPIHFALWPETAFPDLLGEGIDQSHNAYRLKSRLKSLKLPLITGAYSKYPDTEQTTNGMLFLDQNGKYASEPYFKTHLLAFGEYIPLAWAIPSLPKILPQVANFHPGDGPDVRIFNGLKIGPQICYESLFPDFSVKLAQKGAQFIVNITNDSWYGDSAEPFQHMQMTLARAIETRLPLIRSTNTGFTTAVLANGKILERSPLFASWTKVFEIPFVDKPQLTFYVRYFWLFTCLLVLLCLISILILRTKKNPPSQWESDDASKANDYEGARTKRNRLASRR